PEEPFGWIVDEHGIVGDSAPVIVQIMRALRVVVICAAIDGQVALVIDRELILIEMLMFREIWTAIELDPGGVRLPSVAHDQVPHSWKVSLARQFPFVRQGRIAWRTNGNCRASDTFQEWGPWS